MQRGAKSFMGFAALVVPTIIGFVVITGIKMGVLAFVGLFFVLQFANNLDRKS